MASSYDNQSFLSGIAVGRQLKGWSTGEGSGGAVGEYGSCHSARTISTI